MRLFSDGSFYLSRSSSLAAEYLCDRDTIQQHRNTGLLLSTVAQMQTLSVDKTLYSIDISIYDTCPDVCTWVHGSAHSYVWMLDYFMHLDVKCAKLFEFKRLTWDFIRRLHEYTVAFDALDIVETTLPLTPIEARITYAENVKRYQYRKVKLPFWLDLNHTSSRPAAPPVADFSDDLGLDLSSLLGPIPGAASMPWNSVDTP